MTLVLLPQDPISCVLNLNRNHTCVWKTSLSKFLTEGGEWSTSSRHSLVIRKNCLYLLFERGEFLSLLRTFPGFEVFQCILPWIGAAYLFQLHFLRFTRISCFDMCDPCSFRWPLWRICFRDPGYDKKVKHQFLLMLFSCENISSTTIHTKNESTLHPEWIFYSRLVSRCSKWDETTLTTVIVVLSASTAKVLRYHISWELINCRIYCCK